MRKHTHRLSH